MNCPSTTAAPPVLPSAWAPTIKQCRCGATYTHDEWNDLPLVGAMTDGGDGWLELRNCVCSSTIAIELKETA